MSLLPVDEALARVIAAAMPLGIETLPLAAARSRVLAADCHSAHPLPLFTQSAVDGYALRRADLGALPATLPLAAPIAARGHRETPVLPPGMAARILTGSLLPHGADTVVRQEWTERLDDAVRLLDCGPPGTDIRVAGEEMAAGVRIAAAGALVTPGLIGALALGGVQEVAVWRLPRVVVLVSGDEVVQDGGPLLPGQVPDANGPLVAAYLAQWGVPLLRLKAVADRPDAVHAAMARAFEDAELVLTTGGVSVGDHDYIPRVAEALGAERLVWKVAQKPGMPLYVARRDGRLLFGLPGNPASVLVNLVVYVRAALDAMQGLAPAARWHPAAPPEAVRDRHKTLWRRVRRGPGGATLQALGGQASHMLGNLAEADALLRLAPEAEGGDRYCLL